MTFSVVTLSRYPEHAQKLIASIRRFHQEMPQIVVVCDRHDHIFGHDIGHVSTKEPFIFARNANLGITYSSPENDIILINDDCSIEQEDTLTRLAGDAAKRPEFGIVAPLIDGGVGNPYQSKYHSIWGKENVPDMIEVPGTEISSAPVCFVAVYLKRKMLNEVGPLDENYTGYGFDDNDYCIRARLAGWKTVITRSCWIRHGHGGERLERGKNWSSSFVKEVMPDNREYFREKWAPKVKYCPYED